MPPARRRHTLAIALVFLALGACTTYLAAFLAALQEPMWYDPVPVTLDTLELEQRWNSPATRLGVLAHHLRAMPATDIYSAVAHTFTDESDSKFPSHTKHIPVPQSALNQVIAAPGQHTLQTVGWPMRAFWGFREKSDANLLEPRFDPPLRMLRPLPASTRSFALPRPFKTTLYLNTAPTFKPGFAPFFYRPLWTGLLLNTLFFATLWLLPILALLHARRFLRSRSNLCAYCAYSRVNLDPHQPCPECGRPASKSAAPAYPRA